MTLDEYNNLKSGDLIQRINSNDDEIYIISWVVGKFFILRPKNGILPHNILSLNDHEKYVISTYNFDNFNILNNKPKKLYKPWG